jgi:hypothetical protein
MAENHCIVLADAAIDFVVGQPWCFKTPANADKAFVVCLLALRLH